MLYSSQHWRDENLNKGIQKYMKTFVSSRENILQSSWAARMGKSFNITGNGIGHRTGGQHSSLRKMSEKWKNQRKEKNKLRQSKWECSKKWWHETWHGIVNWGSWSYTISVGCLALHNQFKYIDYQLFLLFTSFYYLLQVFKKVIFLVRV